MEHVVTLKPRQHIGGRGSIPYAFAAECTCFWSYNFNAPKWTLSAVQEHWIEAGLTDDRGLLPSPEFLAGLKRDTSTS